MYDTNERILQKLAATGQQEFSADMIKEAMSKVEEEDLEIQYQEWLKHEEAGMQQHGNPDGSHRGPQPRI